ncbi:hypothetical protein [Bosea sp. LjRoot237]|uniref:hypothetical protein n=1 Tax=Bosea sp. LjRoot237 TaxID=3342292 RepID=UPI003ED155D2
MNTGLSVMVGLVPAITFPLVEGRVQDVDARHKGEHDELEQRCVHGFRAQAFGLPRNDAKRPLKPYSSFGSGRLAT